MEACYLDDVEDKRPENFLVYLCEERSCDQLKRDNPMIGVYKCNKHEIYKTYLDVEKEKTRKLDSDKIFEMFFKNKKR